LNDQSKCFVVYSTDQLQLMTCGPSKKTSPHFAAFMTGPSSNSVTPPQLIKL
jgi:hypothetical protein